MHVKMHAMYFSGFCIEITWLRLVAFGQRLRFYVIFWHISYVRGYSSRGSFQASFLWISVITGSVTFYLTRQWRLSCSLTEFGYMLLWQDDIACSWLQMFTTHNVRVKSPVVVWKFVQLSYTRRLSRLSYNWHHCWMFSTAVLENYVRLINN